MKMNKRLVSSAVMGYVMALALTTQAEPPVKAHGTDILHFFVRKDMTDGGLESGAAGRIDAKQNQQGQANNERLEISLTGLATNAPYQLFAVLGSDTNWIPVVEFNADDNGVAALRYRKSGNGNGNSLGKGKAQLPAVLDPLSDIRALAVFNSSTQAVLSADLTAPDKLQYLIKRDLSTGDVNATLRIKATTQQTQFRLLASGLAPTNDYQLVFNGEVVQTNGTDDKGKLMINSLLQNPVEILDLHTVALWDRGSNAVLTTDLP